MNWWENDPIEKPAMNAAKATANWWENDPIDASGTAEPPELPSVYSQFPQVLENPTGMAATLGASDAQMGDIIEKQLGDKFIRREQIPGRGAQQPVNRAGKGAPIDAGGYEIFVTRGPNGEEQRGYLNKPGLDTEDVARGVRGALPYVIGGAGSAIPRGLAARTILGGATAAGTSMAGDVAQIPLGSKQGIEGGKAAAVGLLGLGTPLASHLIGNGTAAVSNAVRPLPQELLGTSRGAVNRVTEAMDAAHLDPAMYAARARELGPEGILGDMGETLQTDTARLARLPSTRDTVMGVLEPRAEGAAGRIRATADRAIGPEINLPQHIRAANNQYRQQAAPFYQDFYQNDIPVTPQIRNLLQRAEAAGAARRAEQWMAEEGLPISRAGGTVSGQYIQYVKEALDDIAELAVNQPNALRRLTAMNNELRNTVDSILSPANPRQSPWARARAIAGEGLEGEEAARLGATAFGPTPKDPHAVAEDLAGLSQFGAQAYSAGGRNKIRQIMGRAASNAGPKGDSAARRALNSEFGRENLSQIIGPQNADEMMGRIRAENAMAETYDMAHGNSITSTMEGSKGRYPNPADSSLASEAGKKGPVGLLTEGAVRVVDALVGGALNRQRVRIALDAAELLVSQGARRDEVARAIFQHAAGRVRTAQQAEAVRRLAQTVLSGGQQPAARYQQQN